MPEPGQEVLIGAVVIARNEAATVGICLAALRRALDQVEGGEVLLVDSASTDQTAQIAGEAGCRVIEVRAASRICPSAMRWIGASKSHSRYLLFLDGDCELEAGFLPAALRAMESDPSLGAVAGLRRDYYRTRQGMVPAPGEYYKTRKGASPARVPAYGGCALYRRRALDAAGSFDPFLRAKEEEDLAQRIRAAGYRIEVLQVPMIRHMTVPRESARRILRSLRHGFYIGRGEAARTFLLRGEVRAALRGLDRVLFTFLHLGVGAACLAAWATGTRWPAGAWLVLSAAAFGLFALRTRSILRSTFYIVEWLVQGVCLAVGFLTPQRAADSFQWDGEERPPQPGRTVVSLPRVLLAGPLPSPPFRGGVEKGVDLLLRGDLARRCRMRLFNTYRAHDPGRSIRSRLAYQIGMLRGFRKELKAVPPDLVHVKASSGINFHQGALYALLARWSGFPVILQIHSGRFEAFYRRSALPLRAWMRWSLSRCTRVAVLSQYWEERLAAVVPRARVAVVPNGLDEAEMVELGADGEGAADHVFFLGTGRDDLNRDKGIEDLLSVLPDLVRKHTRSRWTLAGLEFPERAMARIREAGIDPETLGRRVACVGLVDPDVRRRLLRESGILVVPSYFENMPNILLEGMAAGLGVVATAVGAIPEMLDHGQGGLLVSPGDRSALAGALDRLLGSSSLARAQGRRNRSTVAGRYTMAIVERRLAGLYREVVGWPPVAQDAETPSERMSLADSSFDGQARPMVRS